MQFLFAHWLPDSFNLCSNDASVQNSKSFTNLLAIAARIKQKESVNKIVKKVKS